MGQGLSVVVLAAGEGKRFRSALPKPLHPVAGRPLLWHVLAAAAPLSVVADVPPSMPSIPRRRNRSRELPEIPPEIP